MKNKLVIPLIIVAGIAALYFLGKSRLMKLKIIFRGFKITGGILRPKFNLKFGLQNPTNETANLNSIVGEVIANGKTIANVSTFDQLTIQANRETELNIIAEPIGISIAKTVIDFIKSRNKLIVEFKGSANVDNIVYPLNNSLTV
jgi:hypothetical protein